MAMTTMMKVSCPPGNSLGGSLGSRYVQVTRSDVAVPAAICCKVYSMKICCHYPPPFHLGAHYPLRMLPALACSFSGYLLYSELSFAEMLHPFRNLFDTTWLHCGLTGTAASEVADLELAYARSVGLFWVLRCLSDLTVRPADLYCFCSF